MGNKSLPDRKREKAEIQKTWSRITNKQFNLFEGSGTQWWWLGTHTLLVLFHCKEFIMGLTSHLSWLFKYKSSSSVNIFSSLKHNYRLKVDTKNSTKELHIHVFLISVSIYLIATVKPMSCGPQDWKEFLGGLVLKRCLTGWHFWV